MPERTARRSACLLGVALAVASSAGAARAQTPGRCANGTADDHMTVVGAEVTADSGKVAATVDSTLRELGFAIDSIESRPGQWVTKPSFVWQGASEGEAWRTAEHPGVQVIVDLERDAAGPLRFRVAAGAVCAYAPADSTTPRELEKAMETGVALQVATHLANRLGMATGTSGARR